MIDTVALGEADSFRPEKWEKDWGHGDKTYKNCTRNIT